MIKGMMLAGEEHQLRKSLAGENQVVAMNGIEVVAMLEMIELSVILVIGVVKREKGGVHLSEQIEMKVELFSVITFSIITFP